MKKLAIAILLTLIVMPMTASESNTYYVDMEKIFGHFYKTLEFRKELKNSLEIIDESVAAMEKRRDDLLAERKKLVKELENPTLNSSQRKAKREKISAIEDLLLSKAEEYKEYRTTKTNEIQKRQYEKREEITKELVDLLKGFAIRRKYSALIDISGRSLNNIPIYLYYDKKLEVTDQFIKYVNAGHEDVVEQLKEFVESEITPTQK